MSDRCRGRWDIGDAADYLVRAQDMNRDQFQQNVGYHVNLHPVAIRLDNHGNELEQCDYDWVIGEVTGRGARIDTIHTGHTTLLGWDHIHHFTTNPARRAARGVTYGFLTLTVQLFLQGTKVLVRPTARPGERTTLDGRSGEERAARAHLLDKRLEMVTQDYRVRGTPKPMIETFGDLTQAEKADLFDRAVKLKKGRVPTNNPFR